MDQSKSLASFLDGKVQVVTGDITKQNVDAIVNASLVCRAIVDTGFRGFLAHEFVPVAIGSPGNDSARIAFGETGQRLELVFASGIQINPATPAAFPAFPDAFGRGMRLRRGGFGGFPQLSASFLELGLGALGGFGDFIARAVPIVELTGLRLAVADE